MPLDDVPRSAPDGVDHRPQLGVGDVGRPTTAGAHDVVMMAARLAGDVGMVAIGQVDALDEARREEQVQGPEDRSPADLQPSPFRVDQQVGGAEVAATSIGDELQDRATWRRHAHVAGGQGGLELRHGERIAGGVPADRLDRSRRRHPAEMILSLIKPRATPGEIAPPRREAPT